MHPALQNPDTSAAFNGSEWGYCLMAVTKVALRAGYAPGHRIVWPAGNQGAGLATTIVSQHVEAIEFALSNCQEWVL